MKTKSIFYALVCITTLMIFPQETAAQRRKMVRVKSHRVKVHHRRHIRPIRARRAAHYHYRHLPRWGRSVSTIGAGFVGIRFGGISFRFQKGVWYRPHGRRFVVARAPLGIRVRVLPVGYLQMVVGTITYYYYYGSFYTKVSDSEEFEVVKAPIGGTVDAIPEGYEIVKVDDMEYYKLDETYYEPLINENGEKQFTVVKDPT